ncbi:MAG: septum formation initiator family protein [Nitratireductor sp.]|nr:septum formation initiator family protein [Nitratireductor sp.]
MSTRQKRRNWWSGLVIPGVCLSFFAYFVYHAQTGRYSIYTQEEMRKEEARLDAELALLRAERGRLERRVQQLTVGTLERDALDEIARSQLGYVSGNEIVIFY